MKNHRLFLITVILMIGAGCWSIGSKAEPNTNSLSEVPTMTQSNDKKKFFENLPEGFEQPTDDAGRLLLREYGAVFLARNGAKPPKKVVFKFASEVDEFQLSLKRNSQKFGDFQVDLQEAAMFGLRKAVQDARFANLSISPRGADSSRRGYDQTVSLWASRVEPGLTYWVGKGRVSAGEAKRIRAMSPYEQVPEILKLEQDGIFFAKDLSKSIIYSVAPPGTSQHLSMLALDVKEFDNAKVREILAKNGWFQTVLSDLPHFTYIGVPESDLPALGLKKVTNAGRVFWVPDI